MYNEVDLFPNSTFYIAHIIVFLPVLNLLSIGILSILNFLCEFTYLSNEDTKKKEETKSEIKDTTFTHLSIPFIPPSPPPSSLLSLSLYPPLFSLPHLSLSTVCLSLFLLTFN